MHTQPTKSLKVTSIPCSLHFSSQPTKGDDVGYGWNKHHSDDFIIVRAWQVQKLLLCFISGWLRRKGNGIDHETKY